jgi:cell division protease FtsH
VKGILDRGYAQARAILEQHRDQLEAVTQKLLQTETLDAEAFNRLIGRSTKQDQDRPGPPVDIAPHPAPAGNGNGHQARTE